MCSVDDVPEVWKDRVLVLHADFVMPLPSPWLPLLLRLRTGGSLHTGCGRVRGGGLLSRRPDGHPCSATVLPRGCNRCGGGLCAAGARDGTQLLTAVSYSIDPPVGNL